MFSQLQQLIDRTLSGFTTAQRVLDESGLSKSGNEEGTYRFLCTGDVETFRELGTRFLQMPLGDVELVELR